VKKRPAPHGASFGGITRRDLLHGSALLGLGSLLPPSALTEALDNTSAAAAYPPAKTGLRGNHDGSWETAHRLARDGVLDFGPVRAAADARYDVVIVGGGLSGLAAAYFYREKKPDARILILDNHDDFGGHARRNEFSVGGRTLLGYGGSQTLSEPSEYPRVVKRMLRKIGVRMRDFEQAYDSGFFRRHDLAGGVFFNADDWGESRLLRYDLGGYGEFMPMAASALSAAEAVERMPIGPEARGQLLRVLTETRDCMADVPASQKRDYLYSISYRSFLERHLGVSDPEVFRLLQHLTFELGLGIDSAQANDAMLWYTLPGRRATGIPWDADDFEPYIHHFPDGNASVARLLVCDLMPRVSRGGDMTDILGERFDYDRLDDASADVRLRLSSTVVNVRHLGGPEAADTVEVAYVRGGEAFSVRADHVVLACYHSIIPSLCTELPGPQREAMASQVKMPVLYTSVALNNWRALKELGIGAFVSPTGYHTSAMLDFPVSLGDYRYAESPDEPIVLHMERFPSTMVGEGSKRDRLRAGRHELLATPYDEIERHILAQLSEALGPGGFDAGRDIAAITVNRWAHGYAYEYDPITDETYEDWDDPRYPHVRARQPFGRIAIANSDAGASALLESAVAEAHRAVHELV
jgi:spermidine dehydrogenase